MDGLLVGKETEKRKWIYPLIRKGRLYRWRSWISYAYLALFFTGPLIRIGGQPLLLLNFMDRQFVILGQVFWPQDIFLFVLARWSSWSAWSYLPSLLVESSAAGSARRRYLWRCSSARSSNGSKAMPTNKKS